MPLLVFEPDRIPVLFLRLAWTLGSNVYCGCNEKSEAIASDQKPRTSTRMSSDAENQALNIEHWTWPRDAGRQFSRAYVQCSTSNIRYIVSHVQCPMFNVQGSKLMSILPMQFFRPAVLPGVNCCPLRLGKSGYTVVRLHNKLQRPTLRLMTTPISKICTCSVTHASNHQAIARSWSQLMFSNQLTKSASLARLTLVSKFSCVGARPSMPSNVVSTPATCPWF